MIIYHSVLLRIRNDSDKSCTENQNICLMFNISPSKIVPFNEKIWKNNVHAGRQATETTDDIHDACAFNAAYE
jgi:hypothetical protein